MGTPVPILETRKLLGLDTVKGGSCQTVANRSLCESSREQINLIRRRVEASEDLPLPAWDLFWPPGHARYGGEAAELAPGVVSWHSMISSSLDVPRHQVAAKVVADLAEQEICGILCHKSATV